MKRSDEQRRDVTGIPLREIRICEDGRGRGSKVAFSVHHLNSCPRSQTQLSLLCCAILRLMLPQGNTSASMSVSTVVIRKLNFAMLPSLSMAHPDWGLEQCITRH